MATSSTDKLASLVQCAICLEKLTDPQAFECFHFFCKKCIPGLILVKQDGKEGCTCPTCRRFTAKDHLCQIYFMNKLLEIAELAKDEQKICNMCEKETAELKCIDCKEIYCSVCKLSHDRVPACRNHKWGPLGDDAPLLDRHVYCEKHPSHIAEVHCLDCKTLICLICNGTEHKTHTAETIEQAVKREKAVVVAMIEQVKQSVATNNEDITRAETHLEDINKEYNETEKSIDDKYQEIIMQANKYRDEAKTQLLSKRQQQVGELNSYIEQKTLKLKSQENIVCLSETTLSTTQNASLLNILQAGVAQSLDSCLSDQQEMANYTPKLEVRFRAATSITSNFIGTIEDRTELSKLCETKLGVVPESAESHRLHATSNVVGNIGKPGDNSALSSGVVTRPLFIQRSLSGMVNGRFDKLLQNEMYSDVYRFTMINNELWCVFGFSNTVCILDLDLTPKRNIQFPNIGNCNVISKIGHGLVVATKNGLYHCQMDGSNVQQITGGGIVDMCWEGNTGYTLNDKDANILLVQYDEKTDKFIMGNKIPLNSYERDSCNTIQTTKDHIFIGQYSEDTIRKFMKSGGDVVSYHGSYGSGRNQLYGPWLCGADSDGSLLIADQCNNRFQVLSSDGTWHTLRINDLYEPRCAVIDNNVMYIAHGYSISKFQID